MHDKFSSGEKVREKSAIKNLNPHKYNKKGWQSEQGSVGAASKVNM